MEYLARENQTLDEHLKNVGQLCYDFGNKFNIGNISRIIGLCHDFGKYADEWQLYLKSSLDGCSSDKVEHSKLGASVFIELAKTNNLSDELIPMIFNIISSHHGHLHDDLIVEKDGTRNLYVNSAISVANDSRIENIISNSVDIIKSIEKCIPLANEEFEKFKAKHRITKNNCYYDYSILSKMLYSILIDSDRIDAGKFICEKNGYSFEELNSSFMKYVLQFPKNTRINASRDKVLKQCISKGNTLKNRIYGVKTPTGSGKTCSTLGFALSNGIFRNIDRVIYVAPYLSILDQNEKIYREIFGNGNIIVEDFSSSCETKDTYTENWNKPIVMTTMVNFMNTIMSSNGSELRKLHNIGNSVIILDEMQQLPRKCISNINEFLNEISEFYNSTVLICTATKPITNDIRFRHRLNMEEKDENIVNLSENEIDLFTRRCNYVDMSRCPMDMESICKFVSDKINRSNSMLIVTNTKSESESLYRMLSERFDFCLLLNTNLTKFDRNNIINDIKMRISTGKKVICVSTNLIEAGVDLSFENGIRFCGGEDNIIQTCGRINRNGTMKVGELFIIRLKDEGSERWCEYRITGDILNAKTSFIEKNVISNEKIGSQNSLEQYYRRFFFGSGSSSSLSERTNIESEYEIDGNATAFALLANSNVETYMMKKSKNINGFNLKCTFQYDTVSRNFKMIEDNVQVFICNSVELHEMWERFCKLSDDLSDVSDREKTHRYYRELSNIRRKMFEHTVSVPVSKSDGLPSIFDQKNGIYVDFDNNNYDNKVGLRIS